MPPQGMTGAPLISYAKRLRPQVLERYNITSPGDLRDAARLLDVATTTVASRRQ